MTIFVNDFSTQSKVSQYLECVREAKIRCKKMQLAFNLDKTFLVVQNGGLLGNMVSENGREPDPNKKQ